MPPTKINQRNSSMTHKVLKHFSFYFPNRMINKVSLEFCFLAICLSVLGKQDHLIYMSIPDTPTILLIPPFFKLSRPLPSLICFT